MWSITLEAGTDFIIVKSMRKHCVSLILNEFFL